MVDKVFRVALIRASSHSGVKESAEPLGIEAIAAVLRKNRIDCRLFDRELISFDQAVNAILEYKPSLLGFSVLLEENAPDAIRLMLRIKERTDVPCIVGGIFITTSYEQARALFPGDCKLIEGEGETAILRICSELTNKRYPDMEKPHLSPDEWPWAYRPRLQEYLDIGAPISIRTSRGCPGSCRFCATPNMPHGLNKWQGRKVSDVADEMLSLCKKYKPFVFNFIDDDFGPVSRVEELIDELKKRRLRCAFSLQLRVDAVCRVINLAMTMKKLNEGGLSRVFIGLESFDKLTLDYFGKKIDPEEALEAFQVMRDSGVAVDIGYILWHPLSTPDSVRYEAKRLKDAGFLSTKTIISKLMMFPGCDLQRGFKRGSFAMSAGNYYETVRERIAPLYEVWLKGALDVPLRYSLVCADQVEGAFEKIRMVKEQLNWLDELSYRILLNPESVSEAVILETAYDVREELNAIGSAIVR